MIAWKNITTIEELETAIKTSFDKNVLIFKHSTRCIISKTVLRNFEDDATKDANEKIEFYFLDLLEHRNVSNEIANKLNVEHQSPQILLISNGKCFFNASHEAIDFKGLQEKI
jgi:bacillithiol system protein YtxJ